MLRVAIRVNQVG